MTEKRKHKGLTNATAPEAKKGYLLSSILGIKEYIESMQLEYNENTVRITKGRRDEKERMQQTIMDMAAGSIVEETAKGLVTSVEDLQKMKKQSINLLKARLGQLVTQAKEYIEYRTWLSTAMTEAEILESKNRRYYMRQRVGPKEVNSLEIINILSAIKRELGEPLNIVQSHTTHTLGNELTDEEKLIIEALDTQESLQEMEADSIVEAEEVIDDELDEDTDVDIIEE